MDQATIEKVRQCAAKNATKAAMAKAIGVSRTTIYSWYNRGVKAIEESIEKNEPIPEKDQGYAEVARALNNSQGQVESDYITLVEEKARDGEWRAAAWLLERRFPDTYGPNAKGEEPDSGEQSTTHVGVITVRFEERILKIIPPLDGKGEGQVVMVLPIEDPRPGG